MNKADAMPNYSLEEGTFLIQLARKSILHFLTFKKLMTIPEDFPTKFKDESGVFVTLKTHKEDGEHELRGCIGFPLPIYPLIEATIQAAKSAAVGDPRFPPVTVEELKGIVIEVSILTPPKKLQVTKPEEYLEKIVIGRDGLLIKKGSFSGLLLPQVPVEWNWNVKEFLNRTCNKAGLPKDCWKESQTEVLRFSGIIFQEEIPKGKVNRKEID